MKIIQLNKQHTQVPNPDTDNIYDIHIGIEHLHSYPWINALIEPYERYNIKVNNISYYITEHDILEFEEIKGLDISINSNDIESQSAWNNNTFVTIAYKLHEE